MTEGYSGDRRPYSCGDSEPRISGFTRAAATRMALGLCRIGRRSWGV